LPHLQLATLDPPKQVPSDSGNQLTRKLQDPKHLTEIIPPAKNCCKSIPATSPSGFFHSFIFKGAGFEVGFEVSEDQGVQLVSIPPPDFSSAVFQAYNPSMSDPDPLAGIVPRRVHPRIDGETAVTEHIEKIEGEVALDSYVRAQTSAPQVVKRINELENSLQRVANAALALTDVQRHPELRAAAEEAKLVLKNRLEVDDTKHRFHSELGVFKDDLRIIKD
jgi:hypothetical protein